MSITLNWSNRAQSVTAIKIYRNLHRTETPTLLTTLDTPVETYVDDTAELNKLYFYRVALVIGGEEVPGTIVPMMSVTDTGPGPKTLVSGTMEYGYFGTLTADEFITTDALIGVGTPSGFGRFTNGTVAYWRKFANMGKIIYIPNTVVWSNGSSTQLIQSLQWLYSGGWLYGGGGTAKAPVLTGSVPQNKKINKDAYEFWIRLPKSDYDRDPTTTVYSPSGLDQYGSELSMIISANNYGPNITNISVGNAFPRIAPPAVTTNVGFNYTLTSTLWNTSTACYFATQTSNLTPTAGTSGTFVAGFMPILELILG